MPYISPKKREKLTFFKQCPKFLSAGEINYIVTSLLHKYLKETGLSYNSINTVVGILECVKQEFYQRVAGPYELKKKSENGNVSELDKE